MEKMKQIECDIREKLVSAGFDSTVVWEDSQFLYVGYCSAQIVLSDVALRSKVEALLAAEKQTWKDRGVDLEFFVRGKWELVSVEDAQLATTVDGRFVPAAVVPVHLRSGSTEKVISVLVTHDAQESFYNIFGKSADLKSVARLVVENALRRGGASYWDPEKRPQLEVTSQTAGILSRQLKEAA